MYTKSVEVTNIDESLLYYVGDVNLDGSHTEIGLLGKEDDIPTTFEKAYVIYGGEKIEITSLIKRDNENGNEWDYIYESDIIDYIMDYQRKTREIEVNWAETTQIFILEKDGRSYIGSVFIRRRPV